MARHLPLASLAVMWLLAKAVAGAPALELSQPGSDSNLRRDLPWASTHLAPSANLQPVPPTFGPPGPKVDGVAATLPRSAASGSTAWLRDHVRSIAHGLEGMLRAGTYSTEELRGYLRGQLVGLVWGGEAVLEERLRAAERHASLVEERAVAALAAGDRRAFEELLVYLEGLEWGLEWGLEVWRREAAAAAAGGAGGAVPVLGLEAGGGEGKGASKGQEWVGFDEGLGTRAADRGAEAPFGGNEIMQSIVPSSVGERAPSKRALLRG